MSYYKSLVVNIIIPAAVGYFVVGPLLLIWLSSK